MSRTFLRWLSTNRLAGAAKSSIISVKTEITGRTDMQLSDTMRRYVVHWGEMGGRWGMNRSVAQIHALLFLSEQPLHADEIGETLGIARSNVSTGLKELMGWDL